MARNVEIKAGIDSVDELAQRDSKPANSGPSKALRDEIAMQHRHSSRRILVWFVRHAQSQSNAGEQTTDPSQIALTPLGREQAAHLASAFEEAPDLIVTSPYLRAQQTAEPLRHRFSAVTVETWPVQEFTYLDYGRCVNTSPIERRPLVEAYWQRNDPYHADGQGAESYAELIGRANQMWQRLEEKCAGKWVVIVSHAQFMRAAIWSRLYPCKKISGGDMSRYRHFMSGMPIANGAILKVRFDGEWWFGPIEIGHIPAHLQTMGEFHTGTEQHDQASPSCFKEESNVE